MLVHIQHVTDYFWNTAVFDLPHIRILRKNENGKENEKKRWNIRIRQDIFINRLLYKTNFYTFSSFPGFCCCFFFLFFCGWSSWRGHDEKSSYTKTNSLCSVSMCTMFEESDVMCYTLSKILYNKLKTKINRHKTWLNLGLLWYFFKKQSSRAKQRFWHIRTVNLTPSFCLALFRTQWEL